MPTNNKVEYDRIFATSGDRYYYVYVTLKQLSLNENHEDFKKAHFHSGSGSKKFD